MRGILGRRCVISGHVSRCPVDVPRAGCVRAFPADCLSAAGQQPTGWASRYLAIAGMAPGKRGTGTKFRKGGGIRSSPRFAALADTRQCLRRRPPVPREKATHCPDKRRSAISSSVSRVRRPWPCRPSRCRSTTARRRHSSRRRKSCSRYCRLRPRSGM
jgi:hypothetical protein